MRFQVGVPARIKEEKGEEEKLPIKEKKKTHQSIKLEKFKYPPYPSSLCFQLCIEFFNTHFTVDFEM